MNHPRAILGFVLAAAVLGAPPAGAHDTCTIVVWVVGTEPNASYEIPCVDVAGVFSQPRTIRIPPPSPF